MSHRILIVTPSCHGKNVGAVQKDIYATIEMLQAMGHTVALATIMAPPRTDIVPKEVAHRYGISLYIHTPDLRLNIRLKNILQEPLLFDGAADVFEQLACDPGFTAFVEQFHPDVLLSFCSYSWPILRYARQRGLYSVFRSHNFESSFFWESLASLQKMNPVNWVRCLVKYFGEKKAVIFSSTVATLPVDQVPLYKKWKKDGGVHILSLVFLPKSIRAPKKHTDKKRIDIFYLGANYDVIFHLRGAEQLITRIAPGVVAADPEGFIFHICGAKLPPALVSLCQGNIIYEGYVPDLESFLARMDIAVLPVETGKTMKGKVFESICRSFPVVMSPNCLGGYTIHNEKEALVASSSEAFVEYILLLRSPEMRQRLAEGAHEFSERHFSEASIRAAFTAVLPAETVYDTTE